MATPETTSPQPSAGTAPSGRRKVVIKRGPLSCITHTQTTRGRHIASNSFDVPAEEYGDGNLTGYRIAAEFMLALQTDSRGFNALDVIEEACAALQERDIETGRRGAAVGFLRTIEEVLIAGARYTRHQQHVGDKVERHLANGRERAERKEAAKLDFRRRMEAAKAAKARALREAVQKGIHHG